MMKMNVIQGLLLEKATMKKLLNLIQLSIIIFSVLGLMGMLLLLAAVIVAVPLPTLVLLLSVVGS